MIRSGRSLYRPLHAALDVAGAAGSTARPTLACSGPGAVAASWESLSVPGWFNVHNSLPHSTQQVRGAKKKAAAPAKGKAAKGKAAAPSKKGKARLDSTPMDEKDPVLQRVISLLAPQPRAPLEPMSPEAAAAARARAKDYSRRRMEEHIAWRRDLVEKLRLKQAALAALPRDLRAAADVEDLTPFPLTRHFLYDTPPEAYRD
jgi:hypothetical protein